MSKDKTYQNLKQAIQSRGGVFILLLDPDKLAVDNIPAAINLARDAGVDAFFVGGSFLMRENFNEFVLKVKQHAGHQPVIIFPGSLYQISPHADALLFLSLISGRNPEHLIGNQVMAAPILWKLGLEAISCGYMLIESGRTTSAEFISNSTPIPRDKPEIALAHSLAAKFMGMKTVYLEAGSGARESVPHEMITMISSSVDIPIIVGGGIRTPEDAHAKVLAGSSIVVVGNLFEERDNYAMMHEFADAIHTSS